MPARKPLYIDNTTDELTLFLAADYVDVAQGGTGAQDAAGARTALGLSIGSAIQAWDADLDALGALGSTGFPVRTGANTWAQRTIVQPASGVTVTNGDGIAGNPTLALANDLAAIEALASSGMAVRTGADTWAVRTLQAPAAGIGITNPNGVAGDPTLALANDLAALEGLGSVGFAVRTATDTWAQRSVATASSGRITVTNGDGVAGNPTLDLASSIVTPGTYSSVTVDTYGRVTAGGVGAAADQTVTSLTNNEATTIPICSPVYTDGNGTVRLARADAAGTKNVTGLTGAAIVNGIAGNIVTAGVATATTGQWDAVTGQSGGLTPDAFYYLSSATAGLLTTTVPATNWMVKVGKAISTTKMKLLGAHAIRLT